MPCLILFNTQPTYLQFAVVVYIPHVVHHNLVISQAVWAHEVVLTQIQDPHDVYVGPVLKNPLN